MAKSSSRKKQDRAKAASKRAEQERRQAKVTRQRQSAEGYRQLNDPSTSPAGVAEVLAEKFPDRAITSTMMQIRMAMGVPADEVNETARLLLERAAPQPPGVGALAVAAMAAHLTGDEDAERRYMSEMLARTDASRDAGQWLEVIASSMDRDHPGEACELIKPYLREYPEDDQAGEIYAIALQKAYAQGEPGELEKAALDRFRDRSDVDALDRRLDEFTARTPWGGIIRKWVDGERAGQKREQWKDAERDTADALLAQAAVHFPIADDVEDGAPDTAIRAFAANPDTPTELAMRAIERDEHARYGIWQVASPSPSPGIWCTDLLTGTRRYAQFPAEATNGMPPWSVWLGGLTSAEGIWRAGCAGVWLSPVEGDAVTEYAEDTISYMLHSATGAAARPPLEQLRFGQAEPYCVHWETDKEPEPEFGHFTSAAVAHMASRLAGWIWTKRAKGAVLTNTDGEPLELIDATLAVDGDVTERLFARPDFGEEEDGEDGEVVWWSETIDDPYDQPIVLGRLMPEPGQIGVQVNSQRRMKRLLRILKEIGAAPKVTEESLLRPSVDFAWGSVPGSRETARQWSESWLDQTVAVLGFRTPRHAAQGDYAARLRLEGLLRQLEYQSALPAERGGRPVDTAWLRAELGLESMPRP